MVKKKNGKPKIGKYTLDTLSIGMYNNPLMVLREYVQNSVDAIDALGPAKVLLQENTRIDIIVDGKTRSLKIHDNGTGVPANQAWNILHDVGKSTKKMYFHRGFRGIGRLGGLGYCQSLRFETKAKGETSYSVSEWNCDRLRSLIKAESKALEADEIIERVVDFGQKPYHGNPHDHFFDVELRNLKSSRDVLLDVPTIKSYLQSVAPVPFNISAFSFADNVDQTLRQHLDDYETYYLTVNGEQILKPYGDIVSVGSDTKDKVANCDFFELGNGEGPLAFCWLGNVGLLGAVSPSSLVDGIRVRSGNILIGDKTFLSDFFRERRFNSYLVGELHIADKRLLPNSRRDDFEDNEIKDELLDSFIREIGLPYSRKIRELSQLRGRQKAALSASTLTKQVTTLTKSGVFSDSQRNRVLQKVASLRNARILSAADAEALCKQVTAAPHFFAQAGGKIPPDQKVFLIKVCEAVYQKCHDLNEADAIAHELTKNLLSDRK